MTRRGAPPIPWRASCPGDTGWRSTARPETTWGRFALYAGEEYLGCIRKEFALFHPRFTLDCNGWEVEGSFLEWDYAVTDPAGRTVMAASKELLHWTDTYVLDIARPEDALLCLMIVLAIDAAKCSAGNG